MRQAPAEPVGNYYLDNTRPDSITPSINHTAPKVEPRPMSGMDVRRAAIDLHKRHQKLKEDKRKKRISQEDFDKRLGVLIEEGNRLAEMDRNE